MGLQGHLYLCPWVEPGGKQQKFLHVLFPPFHFSPSKYFDLSQIYLAFHKEFLPLCPYDTSIDETWYPDQ